MTVAVASVIGAGTWSVASLRAPDALNYDIAAQYLMRNGFSTSGLSSVAFFPGKQGYAYTLATLYTGFGPSFAVALVGNAVALGLLVPVIGDTVVRLSGRAAIGWTGPAIALWPSLHFWGAQPLREAIIWLCCAAVINCIVRLVRHTSALPFVVAVAALAVLSTFRQYMSVVLAMALVITLLVTARSVGNRARAVALLIVIGVPAALLLAQTAGIQQVLNTELAEVSLSEAEAGSATGASADLSSPTAMLATLPLAALAVLFGPPIWLASSPTYLFGAVDGLAWFVLLGLAIRGAWQLPAVRRSAAVAPTVAFLLTMAVLCMIAGNYGTIVRFRMELYVLLLPLVVCGLTRRPPAPAPAAQSEERHEGAVESSYEGLAHGRH
ncbi:hypothetical protein [Microlunatus sp. Y2014]|uniref:hypothetical protein n=1 Tax=Microlunatus sp. Y2014 TaxID=3418488 RepID=UPI003DA75EAC